MLSKADFQKGRMVSINPTNAVPKRVLQITNELSEYYSTEYVCWKRFPFTNVKKTHLIHGKYYFIFYLKLAAFMIKNKFDLILFDDFRFLPLCVFLSKLTDAKIIYNRQEVPVVKLAALLTNVFFISRKKALNWAHKIECALARKVTAVLTIPLAGDDLTRIESWGRPIISFWNLPEKKTVNLDAPIYYRGAKEDAILVYSGSVGYENGLLIYLELINKLNRLELGFKVRLKLVGRLWGLSESKLDRLIVEKNCEGLVEYSDWVPYDELINILAKSDVGLAFTDPKFEKYKHMAEGASRKIFTYMSVGLPVVTGGYFGKFVQDIEAGFYVAYDDVDSLAGCVCKILTDINCANNLSINAKLSILNKYNFEKESFKLHKYFEKILSY